MQSLNPKAVIQNVAIFPKNRKIFKEECSCGDNPKHWSVVLQQCDGKGAIIDEATVTTTFDEKLADYVMDIICDEGLQIPDFVL